ncbi:MAG: MATE family efflux transporter [Tissierellaceae bacterium]|nr:MATE family efflux transporter [Tissierellaceae bacterium]
MIKNDKTELILNGDVLKALIILSIPIIINNFIQTLFNLVDAFWVGKISSVHFAATSFVWPVNFLFISLGIGISIAGTSLLSQLVGANKIKEAQEYASQIIAISIIMALSFTVIGYILSPYIIKAMGADVELAELSNIYLRITFLDTVFLFLFFNINSIMSAQGNTVTPTILSGVSAIVNMILDPIFIFTFDLGIAGAAWATFLSRALLAIIGCFLLFSESNKIKPNFKDFKFNKKILKDVLKVGFPSSIGQSGSAIGFMVLNGFVVSYGTATLAAFGMVNRITSLVMQFSQGIGAALTSVVGQNIGANQYERVNEAFRKASKIAVSIGVIGCIILIYFDQQLIDFFIQSKDDPSVIAQSISFLRYISLSMPFLGIFSVFQGLYQGSGNTKFSMTMEIGRLWGLRIPMILLFKYFTEIGSDGIWFSMSASNLFVCVYGFIIYKSNKWKRTVLSNV